MADRADSGSAFAAPMRLAGVLTAAALCAACTADVAGYSVVTQDKYAIMACPDIINNRNALTAHAQPPVTVRHWFTPVAASDL